jgi:hypothetical protein
MHIQKFSEITERERKNLLDATQGGAPAMAILRRWGKYHTRERRRRRLLQRLAASTRRLRPANWNCSAAARLSPAADELVGERVAGVSCIGAREEAAGGRRRHFGFRTGAREGVGSQLKTLTACPPPFQTKKGGPAMSELTEANGRRLSLTRQPYRWARVVRFSVNRPELTD